MVGIGAQELLLLVFCAAVPLGVAAAVFILGRWSARKSPPDDDEF
jgi:hypothetical protein